MPTTEQLSLRQRLRPIGLPLTILTLSSLGLGFSPSAPLVVVLLSVLLVHARTSNELRNGAQILGAAVGLVPGLATAFHKAIHSALRPSSHAVVALGLLAGLLTAVVLAIISGSVWLASRPVLQRTPLARLHLFPVLWSSAWAVLGLTSPLGRQAAWTPLEGALFDSTALLIPYLGPLIIDFALALSAGLLAETIIRVSGMQNNTPSNGSVAPERDLLQHTNLDGPPLLVDAQHDDATATTDWTPLLPSARNTDSQAVADDEIESDWHEEAPDCGFATPVRSLVIAASQFLGLLALLSTFAPGPGQSIEPLENHTPLSIACVLRSPSRDDTRMSALERYLAESRRLVSSATVLLWPEEAVSLSTEVEWEEMVTSVGDVAKDGSVWIAVGFAAPDFTSGMRTNAVVMVGPGGEVVGEYHKQHRVPIAESFSIAPHPQTPPVLTLSLPHPPHAAKSRWSTPELKYRRPTSATFAICNDLNFPDLLASSRSALTLVPSSTWHPAVGLSLLAQARSRALESDASLVLCDSGADGRSAGVSGFVDRSGRIRQLQVGGGSFVVRASLDRYTSVGPRTTFQRLTEAGAAGIMLLAWMLAAIIENEVQRMTADESRLMRLAAHVNHAGRTWFEAAKERLMGRTESSAPPLV